MNTSIQAQMISDDTISLINNLSLEHIRIIERIAQLLYVQTQMIQQEINVSIPILESIEIQWTDKTITKHEILWQTPNTVSSPRTTLGAELHQIREKIVNSGTLLLDWAGIEQEIAERRGEGHETTVY